MFRIRIRWIRMLLGLPDPHPDSLDRGTDPRIRIRNRIRTKMSRIHNISTKADKLVVRTHKGAAVPGIWLVRRPYQRLFNYTGSKALVPNTGFIRGILRGVRYAKSLRVLFSHRRSPSWTTLVLYSSLMNPP